MFIRISTNSSKNFSFAAEMVLRIIEDDLEKPRCFSGRVYHRAKRFFIRLDNLDGMVCKSIDYLCSNSAHSNLQLEFFFSSPGVICDLLGRVMEKEDLNLKLSSAHR